jgi:hypothetical protein
VFVFPGGEFVHLNGAECVVKPNNGPTGRCVELGRNADFIDLYDQATDVKVRLRIDRGETYDRQQTRFVPWSPGFRRQ